MSEQPDLFDTSGLCPFCKERPATLLCDYVIGFYWSGEMGLDPKTGKEWRVIAREEAEMFTCDRPICRACATIEGSFFASGKSHFTDTTDLCPQCVGSDRSELKAISREEAKAERARLWRRSDGFLKLLPAKRLGVQPAEGL